MTTIALRNVHARHVALWIVTVVTAAMFFMSGTMKLSGAPMMVQLFDAIGVGQWFRYVTGGLEVASAAILFVPSLAFFGAALLVPTMIGAIATHLFIVGGSPAIPFALLLASTWIAFERYPQNR